MLVKQDGSNNLPSGVDKVLLSKETQTEAAKVIATPATKRKTRTRSPSTDTTEGPPGKKSNTEGKQTPKISIPVAKPKEPDWTRVEKKNKVKKKSVRPDALVIKSCSDMSYAEILKKVKADGKLTNLGDNVRSIRKTENGELLVELNKAEHENLHQFQEAMKSVLGNDADVRSVTHEVMLEIKDIDEITTKEEILESLNKVADSMNDINISAIKSLRRAYGNTQTALLSLSAPLANALLTMAKIKIGWVVCRIRQKITPRKCFKCLDYGHIAAKCKSEMDYRDCCIKCGENGHKIRDCKNTPKCLLCSGGKETSNHVTGSVVCPKYKKAVELLKTKG